MRQSSAENIAKSFQDGRGLNRPRDDEDEYRASPSLRLGKELFERGDVPDLDLTGGRQGDMALTLQT